MRASGWLAVWLGGSLLLGLAGDNFRVFELGQGHGRPPAVSSLTQFARSLSVCVCVLFLVFFFFCACNKYEKAAGGWRWALG